METIVTSLLQADIDDYCNYNASGVVLHVGGNYNQNQNHGLFYLNGNNAATNKNANIGSRLLLRLNLCRPHTYFCGISISFLDMFDI